MFPDGRNCRKGDFHYADFSNGLTNANGVILFNGTRATIQSLTAESGGGKVEATGFAALTGGLMAFRLEAKTRDVRVRYPRGRQHGFGRGSDAGGHIPAQRSFGHGHHPPDFDQSEIGRLDDPRERGATDEDAGSQRGLSRRT